MIKELTTKGKYIVLDTETEGLNLAEHRPFEFAFLLCENGKITKKEQHFLWWHNLKVSEGAAKATNFNYKEYKEKAQDPLIVFDKVKDYLVNPAWTKVGHNIYYDFYIIKNWLWEIGRWSGFRSLKPVIDSNALFKAYQKGDKPDFKNFESWQFKWVNHKERGLKSNLTFACKEFGIDVDETKTHVGINDIEYNLEVFKQLCYRFQES